MHCIAPEYAEPYLQANTDLKQKLLNEEEIIDSYEEPESPFIPAELGLLRSPAPDTTDRTFSEPCVAPCSRGAMERISKVSKCTLLGSHI